jgi:NAD(P)-dependent dehydrogenase (short-subunit alcohol dehydrogenase family)
MGRRALGITGDVSRVDDVNRFVAETLNAFGHLDVLVNNAAISPIYKRVERITEEEWDAINAVNLKGTFLCSQAAGRAMIEQRRGKIINIASAGGISASQRLSAYAATKAGVIMLTKVLAVEWAQFNIQVNAIAPGWVATEFTQGLRNNPELYATLCAQSPLNRFAEPEEIAGAAIYLASELSNYATGSTLVVDGGITAW